MSIFPEAGFGKSFFAHEDGQFVIRSRDSEKKHLAAAPDTNLAALSRAVAQFAHQAAASTPQPPMTPAELSTAIGKLSFAIRSAERTDRLVDEFLDKSEGDTEKLISEIEKYFTERTFDILSTSFSLDQEEGLNGAFSSDDAVKALNILTQTLTLGNRTLSPEEKETARNEFAQRDEIQVISFSQLSLEKKTQRFEVWISSDDPGTHVDKEAVRNLNRSIQEINTRTIRELRNLFSSDGKISATHVQA